MALMHITNLRLPTDELKPYFRPPLCTNGAVEVVAGWIYFEIAGVLTNVEWMNDNSIISRFKVSI